MIFYGWRQKQDNNNLAKLEASLAPAEAEFVAVAKADQKAFGWNIFTIKNIVSNLLLVHDCE